MKNRFDFGWSGNLRDSETERERGGSATNSESGWCKTQLVDPRASRFFNRGRNLFVRETSGQNRSRKGREPAENRGTRSCPYSCTYFRPRARFILSSTGHERNERSDRGKKKKKKERKDVGRTKGRNAWKIDRLEKCDRSFVDEWLPSASRWPAEKENSYGRCNWKAFEY